MKYVRQNLSFLPRVVQHWHRFPRRLGRLFSEVFVTTSSSFALYCEQGFWLETCSEIFLCNSSWDAPLGFPSLSPTGEDRIIPLGQFCRPRKSCGMPSKEVTQSLSVSQVCCMIVPVPISLAPAHCFPSGSVCPSSSCSDTCPLHKWLSCLLCHRSWTPRNRESKGRPWVTGCKVPLSTMPATFFCKLSE